MMDIGSQLRAAREAQGLTLDQAFKGTRIKVSFLEAIEANQFDVLPGPVQARGFVRSYGNFLGLDGEHLASALDADKSGASEVRPLTHCARGQTDRDPGSHEIGAATAAAETCDYQAAHLHSAEICDTAAGQAHEPIKRSLKIAPAGS